MNNPQRGIPQSWAMKLAMDIVRCQLNDDVDEIVRFPRSVFDILQQGEKQLLVSKLSQFVERSVQPYQDGRHNERIYLANLDDIRGFWPTCIAYPVPSPGIPILGEPGGFKILEPVNQIPPQPVAFAQNPMARPVLRSQAAVQDLGADQAAGFPSPANHEPTASQQIPQSIALQQIPQQIATQQMPQQIAPQQMQMPLDPRLFQGMQGPANPPPQPRTRKRQQADDGQAPAAKRRKATRAAAGASQSPEMQGDQIEVQARPQGRGGQGRGGRGRGRAKNPPPASARMLAGAARLPQMALPVEDGFERNGEIHVLPSFLTNPRPDFKGKGVIRPNIMGAGALPDANMLQQQGALTQVNQRQAGRANNRAERAVTIVSSPEVAGGEQIQMLQQLAPGPTPTPMLPVSQPPASPAPPAPVGGAQGGQQPAEPMAQALDGLDDGNEQVFVQPFTAIGAHHESVYPPPPGTGDGEGQSSQQIPEGVDRDWLALQNYNFLQAPNGQASSGEASNGSFAQPVDFTNFINWEDFAFDE
ncbi:hypothetical protein F4777DRAFT_601778 [Nemania sp. FL0916]|nr:hypothetical protein F4777DRAFT_601778 [Nemania sp. FL0916]